MEGDNVIIIEDDPEPNEPVDPEIDLFFISIGRPPANNPESSMALIDLSWTRAFSYQDLVRQVYGTVITHPVTYVRTLVQLGYEPLPGQPDWSFFGQARLYYPNIFAYMNHIIEQDGVLGLFRGLRYNLLYSLAYQFVYRNVLNVQQRTALLEPVLHDPESQFDNGTNLVLGVCSETAARLLSITVAYPLRVLSVRCMAQFVGHETVYNSTWSGVTDLYGSGGGLWALYTGLVPCLLAECVTIYTRYLVFYSVLDKWDSPTRRCVNSMTGHVVTYVSYSLQVVSTVMCCNGPSAATLRASTCTTPVFRHWVQCLRALWHRGEQDRGFYLFWRSRPLPQLTVSSTTTTPQQSDLFDNARSHEALKLQ